MRRRSGYDEFSDPIRLVPRTAPASPENGAIWYDSAAAKLKAREAGSTVDVISDGGGLADPGSNGIVKRTALNTTASAVAGTDYYAPGGAIAPSDFPVLYSALGAGLFWPLGTPVNSGATTFSTTATRFWKFIVTGKQTFNRVGMFIAGNAASAASGLNVGIYGADGTLLQRTTTITGLNAAANTAVTLTFATPLTLVPGPYFLAVVTDDASLAFGCSEGSTALRMVSNAGLGASTYNIFHGANGTGSGGTLQVPASITGTRNSADAAALHLALMP